MEKGQGFGRGGDGRLAELPARARLLPGEEGGPYWWGHPVSEGEREGAYPFGIFPGWAGDGFRNRVEMAPLAFFLFSLFLSLFFFWFSKLLYIFCKFDSNKFLNSSNIKHSVLN
jgi:hypothetical protein